MVRTAIGWAAIGVVVATGAFMFHMNNGLKNRLSEDEAVFVTTCSLLQRTEQCLANVQRLRELDVVPSLDSLTPAVEDN